MMVAVIHGEGGCGDDDDDGNVGDADDDGDYV